MAAVNFSIEHRGFMPPARGLRDINGALLSNSEPATVGDSGRVKYSYYTAGTNTHLLPLPGALASYMGYKKISTYGPSEYPKLRTDLNDFNGVGKYFRCPSADPARPNGLTNWINTRAGAPPRVPSDFAFNEGLRGFGYGIRLEGSIKRIRGGADVMLLADGDARDEGNLRWICFFPLVPGPVTLGDALLHKYNPEGTKAGISSSFDKYRHGGMMNVLFADGHVSTVMIGESKTDITKPSGDLKKIYLIK